ncbi:hypothetical protein [Polaribacter porphyrae]|uniref:DinB-like domain-containing protein n=1 Tax=Polaribacter porphyrae TaxID=1137780 RepID=A0A2S7WN91_9FLAO|nr:hypothetical protein [Polaribacter porphyrae]PQJ78782.1 hypothetical protein BTO18_06100 [Polaribacter porphyrae]
MRKFVLVLFYFTFLSMDAQKKLPYYEIPEAAKEFTPGTTASRMIDGLGFRYYWATEGLKEKDLAFKPNSEARTTLETIDHILGLSQVILNATLKKANGDKQPKMAFAEKRKKTLENLQEASKILRESKDISQYKMIFGETEFPFWNVINGPIADAIWHVGQVVSFRRSSGNPFPKGVSVLRGTKS